VAERRLFTMVRDDSQKKRPSKVDKVKKLLNDHAGLYDFIEARAEAEKMSVEEMVVQLIQTYKRWVDDDAAEREQQELKGEIVSLLEEIGHESPKQKAREFFEALIEKDFERAYAIGIHPYLRKSLKLEENYYYSQVIRILSIGEPYQRRDWRYKGFLVPYEIELADGSIRRGFIAMRNDREFINRWSKELGIDIPEGEWVFDGGL
jgi:hypothetical protein